MLTPSQFGYSPDDFKMIITLTKEKSHQYIRRKKKKKKKGEFRIIHVPAYPTKANQRMLNRNILSNMKVNMDVAHAYEKGKGIYTNALEHTGKEMLIRIDIKDFFGSIGFKKVYKAFRDAGWNKFFSKKFTNFCLYLEAIPQGAPTSSTLSNAVCFEMDNEIQDYVTKRDVAYTRYCDDLAFSGNEDDVEGVIEYVFHIVEKHGFTINENKTRKMRKTQRQLLCGLVVNEEPNIPRNIYRKLKQDIYFCNKKGVRSHLKYTGSNISPKKLKHKLTGQVNNLIYIDIKKGQKLKEELSKINWNS